ncbi:helix-turn-helix domain-containing protein [Gracilimonas mengyeensis]|uniref:Helix-turn-helix domain-containing protein n=1 Tax=Gracilimonas mengyeensis TaxID=1302730 RepID=A0A521EJX8_9BACT|nr:helix-turn-helix domain-containing protein [Gracilimonas mengyeensis]SMO84225.1 Helix-turn-helix domain-containing protein [Gracilimonas mengyeensis]
MNESVIVTTEIQLEKIFSKLFEKKISETLPDLIAEATAKPYLTKEELMDLTGWSSRSIQNLRDTDQIPYSKHGRKILYPRKGILEFLQAHHIQPEK